MAADLTILGMKRDAGQGSTCTETVTVSISVFRGNSLETLTPNITNFKSSLVMDMTKVENT